MKIATMGKSRGGLRWLWISLAVLLLNYINLAAPAQTYISSNATGYWSDPTNWDSGTVPTTGGDVVIGNFYTFGGPTGTVYLDTNYDASTALNSLDLDAVGTYSVNNYFQVTGDLVQNSAAYNMYVNGTETIGDGESIGQYDQTAGTNTAGELAIGSAYFGANGTYNLSGDSTVVLTAGDEELGSDYYSGYGVFNQSGGVNNAGTLHITGGANSQYNLSGGTLNAANIAVGAYAYFYGLTGDFNQTGGSNDATEIDLGINPVSIATYELNSSSSSATLDAGLEIVGVFGGGSFTQSGGVNTIDTSVVTNDGRNQLIVGEYSGAGLGYPGTAQYLLEGGTLNGATEIVGDQNSLSNGDTADFNQTGGINNATELDLGHDSTVNNGANPNITGPSVGSYELSGDATVNLNAGVENIGLYGSGTFTQTGGVNTVQDPVALTQDSSNQLVIGANPGSTGHYLLQSGTLNGAYEYVGSNNSQSGGDVADLNQTGGTNNAIELHLGANSGSVGTYELSGIDPNTNQPSALNAGAEYVGDGGTGTFTQTGGVNSLDGSLDIVNSGGLFIGYQAGSHGQYNLEGGSITTPNANFEVVGLQNSRAGGDSADFNQTGGTNFAAAGLSVGESAGSVGTYELSGDSSVTLTAGVEYIGYYGKGTFTQDGGLNSTENEALYVGEQQGSVGQYVLESGTLTSSTETVGDNNSLANGDLADFNHRGGSNQLSGKLTVGQGSGSVGTYELDDGEIDSYSEVIGDAGKGTFIQFNGVNNVENPFTGDQTTDSTLIVGNQAGSVAEYSLQSGTLNGGYEYVGYSNSESGGDSAQFRQANGTNNAIELHVAENAGSVGNYDLNGTAALNATTEIIGKSGDGEMIQNGGTNTVTSLVVGEQTGSSGQYALQSGTLTAAHINVGYSNAATDTADFNQTGGANAVSNELDLGENTGSTGSYELAGGTLTANKEFVGVSGVGTLTQAASATNTFGALNIANNSTYTDNGGNLTGTPGTGTTGSITNYGTLTGYGTFTVPGGLTNEATLTFTSGNVIFYGDIVNDTDAHMNILHLNAAVLGLGFNGAQFVGTVLNKGTLTITDSDVYMPGYLGTQNSTLVIDPSTVHSSAIDLQNGASATVDDSTLFTPVLTLETGSSFDVKNGGTVFADTLNLDSDVTLTLDSGVIHTQAFLFQGDVAAALADIASSNGSTIYYNPLYSPGLSGGTYAFGADSFLVAEVPEPSTYAMFLLGGALLAGFGRGRGSRRVGAAD